MSCQYYARYYVHFSHIESTGRHLDTTRLTVTDKQHIYIVVYHVSKRGLQLQTDLTESLDLFRDIAIV